MAFWEWLNQERPVNPPEPEPRQYAATEAQARADAKDDLCDYGWWLEMAQFDLTWRVDMAVIAAAAAEGDYEEITNTLRDRLEKEILRRMEERHA